MAQVFLGDLFLAQSAPGRWKAEGRSLNGVVYGVIGGASLLTILVVVGSGALKAKDMQTGWPFLLFGLIACVSMILLMLRSPVRQIVDVDRHVGAIVLSQVGLLGASEEARTRRDVRQLRDVVLVLREASLNRRVISIGFASGGRWVLSFKNDAAEVDALADFLRGESQRLRGTAQSASGDGAEPAAAGEGAVTQPDHAVTDLMLRQVRSSAYWSLGLGALHLIAPGLSKPWGATLVGVGALSLLLPTPAMQIVNVVTILWVAVLNMLSGNPIWGAIAATQLWNGVQSFRRWRKVEQQRQLIEGASVVDGREARARRIFPWAGLGLGLGSMFGIIALFVSAIVYGALYGDGGSATFYAIVGFVETLVVNLGVVGFAVSLAALLAGFRPRPVAVVGLLGGVAAVALEFGLVMLFAGS